MNQSSPSPDSRMRTLALILLPVLGIALVGAAIVVTRASKGKAHITSVIADAQPGTAAINITNGYHDEEAVASLLTQFETNFPALAKKIQIGATTWGRPIWALKISDNAATEEPEPRVVIDANIHAREYAPSEVALDIIWQLLYGYTNNPTFASWVDGMEIYVIPCLNPDGRYYCDTVDSDWRKNGRDNNRNGSMTCPTDGVDLNRNSSFHWGSDNEGSSSTSSDDTYRGPYAALPVPLPNIYVIASAENPSTCDNSSRARNPSFACRAKPSAALSVVRQL